MKKNVTGPSFPEDKIWIYFKRRFSNNFFFYFPLPLLSLWCLGKEDFKPVLVIEEIPIQLEGCGEDYANRLSSGSLEVLGFDMLTQKAPNCNGFQTFGLRDSCRLTKLLKHQKLSKVVCNNDETEYGSWKSVAVFSIWILWSWEIVVIVGFSDNIPQDRIAWLDNLTWRTGLINDRSPRQAPYAFGVYVIRI